MNPLVTILLQAGLNIAKAHVSNKTAGEVLGTTSFIMDAAKAIDDLYVLETGQSLDWSTIRHHQHLPPPGEAPITAHPPETEQPVAESAPEPNPDNPNPENPAES